MKKRLLNLFLVIAMVVCVLPFAASASSFNRPCRHSSSNLVRVNAVNATCTDDGNTAGVRCGVCNTVWYGVEVVPKLGHTPETMPAVPATCTTAGLTAGSKCAECGDILTAQVEIPAGHDFSIEVETVLEPTCTARGIVRYQCSMCEATKKVNVDALGHKKVEIPATEPTCTKSARTAGEECERCHTVFKAPEVVTGTYLGHSYKDGVCTRCEKVCTHDLEATIPAKAATCVTGPISAGKECKICDYVEEPKATGAALGHSYNMGYVTTDPTCTEEGVKTYTCIRQNDGKNCGHTYTEVVPAFGEHSYNMGYVTTQPTCTEEGVKTYTCIRQIDGKNCGHTYTEAVAATGHTYSTAANLTDTCIYCMHKCDHVGKLEITDPAKDATCLSAPFLAGEKCTECNYEKAGKYYGEGLGHNWVNGVCDREGCGKACEHKNKTWLVSAAATCEESGITGGYQCDDCKEIVSGREVVPALGHTYSTVANLTDTCIYCMHKCDHVGKLEVTDPAKDATCLSAPFLAGEKCTECNYEKAGKYQGEGLGHDWSNDAAYLVEVVTEPSCKGENKPGRGLYKCTRCDATAYLDIPCFDCEFVVNEAVAPTCVDTGWTAGEWCKYCHEKNVKTYRQEIPALGHELKLSDFISTQPTCTEKGWGRYVCEREGCEYYEGGWIPATGHDYEVLVQSDPTCTLVGRTGKECKVCKHQVITATDPTGHSEEILDAVEATCTATGLTEGKKCSTCNAVLLAQTVVPMQDHDWEEVPALAATCTTDGHNAYKVCKVCETTQNKEIVKGGHNFVNYKCTVCQARDTGCEHAGAKIEVTNATCTADGLKTFNCSACGYTYEETLKATGHNPVSKSSAATCNTKGKSWTECSVCHETIGTITETGFGDHSYANGECRVCGAADPNYTAPGNPGQPSNPGTSGCQHPTKSTFTNPATCTTSGIEIVSCTDCKAVVSQRIIPALGHTDNTEVQAATCTKNGVKIVTCDRCDKYEYTVLPATGKHNYDQVSGICSSCRGTDPNRFTKDYQDVFLLEEDAKG